MKREVIPTKDGSHTVSIPEMQVTYHSIHGAIQESQHVFIRSGLQHYLELHLSVVSLRIMEMGFGTGLNALLSAMEAGRINTQINYTSLEAYPLEPADYGLLNYGDALNEKDLFQSLHTAPWEQPVALNHLFILHKIQIELEHFESTEKYHLIYFDAFAPAAQPHLWTKEIFSKMISFLEPGGLLLTYCSKGDVRRAMMAAGFDVQKIPGPPGKREMVRAGRIS